MVQHRRKKAASGSSPSDGASSSDSQTKIGLEAKDSSFRVVPSPVSGHASTCSAVSFGGAQKATSYHPPWTPTVYTAFKVLLSARLCSAVWMNISDCDETYNYWEPTHYVLHGTGFQTWEYSPTYALRSYAYVWIHALPLWFYGTLLQGNKLLIFYFLRCGLGLVSAACEAYFYKGIVFHYGSQTGRILLLLLLFCPGMFVASTAYLPSSFAMYFAMLSTSAFLQSHLRTAIATTAVGALLGWPFAAITGAHIVVDLIFRKRDIFYFIKWATVFGFLCVIPMLLIDAYYYGRLVLAPLNIIMYNVFTNHGPDIYGVESWAFYFRNGFLNFNFVFPLAFAALPICAAIQFFLRRKHAHLHASAGGRSSNALSRNKCSTCNVNQVPYWVIFLPMYVWFLVFFTRPHKEERFLFPIYPFILFAASSVLDSCQRLLAHTLPFLKNLKTHYTDGTNWLPAGFVFIYIAFGTFRCVALYQNYHAPMDVYMQLHSLYRETPPLPNHKQVRLCAGKEWHRYPSSFFLPTDQWEFRFVQSEFRAQLPSLYLGPPPVGSKTVPPNMNDQNLEEPTRYVNSTTCHFMIDLDSAQGKETELEPRYSDDTTSWTPIHTVPFLDVTNSHSFYRAFFIPILSNTHNTFLNYHLLKSLRLDDTNSQ